MASGDFNRIQEAIKALHDGLAKAVAEAAQAVERDAKRNAPVATGQLQQSIYTATHDKVDVAAAHNTALHRAAKRWTQSKRAINIRSSHFAEFFPPVEPTTSDLEALVVVGVTYGEYLELGTSRMAAQPFMTPAAEAVRAKLPGKVADRISIELETRLGK